MFSITVSHRIVTNPSSYFSLILKNVVNLISILIDLFFTFQKPLCEILVVLIEYSRVSDDLIPNYQLQRKKANIILSPYCDLICFVSSVMWIRMSFVSHTLE